MKIFPGKQAINRKEATSLAFQVTRVDGMSTDVINMFASIAETDKISSEAEKVIGSVIRSRYGGKSTWHAERWCIPIPELHYDARDFPQLDIEVKTYLVAAANVRTSQDSRLITLAGVVGKPETLVIPMVFLHAILNNDLGRFAIVARDAGFTTWELPGAKPVRLPNEFVSQLTERLKWQSVVSWLLEFEHQGRCVAPLVAGSLLGLLFQDSSQPIRPSHHGCTTEELVSALESIAFRHNEAREMVNCAVPRLRADMMLEEAIRITLQTGKGED